MKIRLIYPGFRKFLEGHPELDTIINEYLVGNYTMPPSLALPIIAALTPEECSIKLTDDNIGQPINYNENVDLVAISCFTPQAARAYEIADEFRRNGKTVILGGMHPSARPEESLGHADAVCVGEVEPLWGQILEDLQRGCLKKKYEFRGSYSLSKFPIPKREIFCDNKYKWNAHLVLTTRGCPVKCEGCSIPSKEGTRLRFRPVKKIVDDIIEMKYKEFYFTDDTLMLPGKRNRKFLLKIMEQTGDLGVKIFLASTMMMFPDPLFYRRLKQGGTASIYTVFGYDRNSKKIFNRDCTKQEWQEGIDLVRMIEDEGIHFFASFGIGFDLHSKDVFDRILKFSDESGIDLAEFYIHTPFPATPFGEQIEREERILHRNYNLWNTGNVVFKPKNFTEDELLDGFYYLWKNFYSNKNPDETLRTFTIDKKQYCHT